MIVATLPTLPLAYTFTAPSAIMPEHSHYLHICHHIENMTATSETFWSDTICLHPEMYRLRNAQIDFWGEGRR